MGAGTVAPGLAPPTNVNAGANLSVLGGSSGSRITAPGNLARFQQFEQLNFGSALLEICDLMTGMGGDPPRITFVPNGSGGSTYFTGTR